MPRLRQVTPTLGIFGSSRPTTNASPAPEPTRRAACGGPFRASTFQPKSSPTSMGGTPGASFRSCGQPDTSVLPQRVESVHRADVNARMSSGARRRRSKPGRASPSWRPDPSATSVARSALPQGRCMKACTATRRRSSIRGRTSVGSPSERLGRCAWLEPGSASNLEVRQLFPFWINR